MRPGCVLARAAVWCLVLALFVACDGTGAATADGADAPLDVAPQSPGAPGGDAVNCDCSGEPYAPRCGEPCEAFGMAECADGCVRLGSDPDNCGACEHACADDEACVAGACLPAPPCGAGLDVCEVGRVEACFDLAADADRCGDCDRRCDENETCAAGACRCGDGPGCLGGTSCCGLECVDVETDRRHCGGCGRPCAAGAVCRGGHCLCEGGQTLCPGSVGLIGGGCFDLKDDPEHCGACSRRCGDDGVCLDGRCFTTCGADGACPDGGCCAETNGLPACYEAGHCTPRPYLAACGPGAAPCAEGLWCAAVGAIREPHCVHPCAGAAATCPDGGTCTTLAGDQGFVCDPPPQELAPLSLCASTGARDECAGDLDCHMIVASGVEEGDMWRGFCSASCPAGDDADCPPTSRCVWMSGSSHGHCLVPCPSHDASLDCPGGGAGWHCAPVVGAAEPQWSCVPDQ